MIKKFGFRNFSSFREGAEISFIGKDYTIEEQNVSEGISPLLGIKGANGSGKTNILKAITFLYCFCAKRMGTKKNTDNENSEIELPIETFMDCDEITEFYIEFIREGTTYYYELDVKKSGIVREEIRRKNKKEVVCLTREKNKITHCLNEFSELKKLKLKADQSVISLPEDFDFKKEMKDLKVMYWHFKKVIFNVGYNGYNTIDSEDYFIISKFYNENLDALEFTKQVISGVDDGIKDIEIKSTLDSETGEDIFYPLFIHGDEETEFPIGLAHESMGTKALFLALYRYWLAIKDGSLLILDEFDTHLHAMILPEIIELFTNKKINKNNAQLIITAHNTEIIDSFGRYKTILVNKENNESYCYRLDEISLLRNDRAISSLYSKGKIGGTPKNIQGLASRIADSWGK
ncbi:MAG: ATP-binding protein [Colwellia sp.]